MLWLLWLSSYLTFKVLTPVSIMTSSGVPNFFYLAQYTICIIIFKIWGRTTLYQFWFFQYKVCKICFQAYTPFIYQNHQKQEFSVFLGVSADKAVCAETTIFFGLHNMQVSSLLAHFGVPTATLKWVLRYLKIAIFEYSLQSCITTWQAETFLNFLFLLLARSASVFCCSPSRACQRSDIVGPYYALRV